MICEVCSDKIEAGEKSVMHKGAPIHGNCYLILDDVTDAPTPDQPDVAQPPSAVDQPEPDELELAYRRGDEVATVFRDSKRADLHGMDLTLSEIVLSLSHVAALGRQCGIGAAVIEELLKKNSRLTSERDSALRRCKNLEARALQLSANLPEGSKVHEVAKHG